MEFQQAPPNPYYDNNGYCQCLLSKEGNWIVGLYPVMFGVRVIVCPNNSAGITLSICAGDNPDNIRIIYLAMILWMSNWKEEVNESIISDNFPRYPYKPIVDNPQWSDYQQLIFTGKVREQLPSKWLESIPES